MPTLTTTKPLSGYRPKVTIPLLFAWDVIRLMLNPDARPTTGRMLSTYARGKPWEKLAPEKLGCQTEDEKLKLAATLIRTGGRSVKQIT